MGAGGWLSPAKERVIVMASKKEAGGEAGGEEKKGKGPKTLTPEQSAAERQRNADYAAKVAEEMAPAPKKGK